MTIDDLFAPSGVEHFISSTLGRSYQVLKGPKSRFGRIFDWPSLNQLLATHRLQSPRLRLVRDGDQLEQLHYIDFKQSRRGEQIPKVDPHQVERHLRDGYSLVIDAVDEASTTVRAMARLLEDAFREVFQANLYASFAPTRGFAVHWDDHDVFILQLDGSKKWRIFGPSRTHPLFRDCEPNHTPPSSPVWEGETCAGDLLYIPRGWWHDALAEDGPSLHLTFGATFRHGIHLVNWLADQLRDEEIFRQDLPQFGAEAQRQNHSRQLKSRLDQVWTDDIIDRFLLHYQRTSRPRPAFSLPHATRSNSLLLESQFRLNIPWPTIVKTTDEEAILDAVGKSWHFAREAAPMLELLATGRPVSIEQLHARVDLSVAQVKAFAEDLLLNGIIATHV